MKILVAVKRVIDYNTRIRVKTDGSGVDTSGVKFSINPFDAIAVEAAMQMKEAGQAAEVVVVSLGDAKCEEPLRSALAFGCDRAIRVETSAIQPLQAASLLQAVVAKEQPTLVLLGKQAIDDDANQTGQMLAAKLGWAQATFASKITLEDSQATVEREVDEGIETLQVDLPAVITSDLRLNTPRFVKLPQIMQAKRKPLAVISAADIGVDVASVPSLQLGCVRAPDPRSAGKRVADVDELLHELTERGLLGGMVA